MKRFTGTSLMAVGRKVLLLVGLCTAVFTSHVAFTNKFATLEAPYAVNAVFTVTSAADTGPGTLRQAMLDMAAGDIITFDTAVFPPPPLPPSPCKRNSQPLR